jgi:outer membrane protein assembly factor BamD
LLTVLLISILFFWNCAGNKPKPDWTAEQYYKFAKKKFDDKDYFEAVNEFTVVVLRFAGSGVADSAQYFLAKSHYHMKEYLIGAVEFEKLINDMGRSPLVPDAQFQLAECYYKLSPRPELDQQYTQKAIREYQYFIEENPTHAWVEDAQKKILELRNKLARKDWGNAEVYRKIREHKSALIYYDQVIDNYYDSDWADDAMYGKIRVLEEMGDLARARTEVEKFEQQFPNSALINKVKFLAKNIEEALVREDE